MKVAGEFKIRKGIPIPPKVAHRPISSVLTKVMIKMEVGDCIDVANFESTRGSLTWRGKLLGYKFRTRTIENGDGKIMRIWRVE